MDKNELQSTNRLLKVIVSLLLRRKDDQPQTLRQQIEVLSDLGIKPVEIAEIIGRNGAYVNKELSTIRKANKEGK